MRVITIILFVSLQLIFLQDIEGFANYSQTDKIGETEKFVFYSNFWLNLHHFIYANARSVSKTDSIWSMYQQKISGMAQEEQDIFWITLKYYQDNLLAKDLLFDDDLYTLKRWLASKSQNHSLNQPPVLEKYIDQLNRFAPIYKKYFWIIHHQANQKVLKDNLDLIIITERQASKRLSSLSQAEWQQKKIRVDICFHSKLNRPYTTINPEVHIVMDSNHNDKPKGNWLELIFHEASHHLILYKRGVIGDKILELREKLNINTPLYLFHAVLFYLSGRVTQDLLSEQGIDYTLYMIRRRVFIKDLTRLKESLEPYLLGDDSLLSSIETLVKSYKEL